MIHCCMKQAHLFSHHPPVLPPIPCALAVITRAFLCTAHAHSWAEAAQLQERLTAVLTLGSRNQDLCSWWGQSLLLLSSLTSQWTTEVQVWQSRWSRCFLPGGNSVHPFLPVHNPSRPYIFLCLWETAHRSNADSSVRWASPPASVIKTEGIPGFHTKGQRDPLLAWKSKPSEMR